MVASLKKAFTASGRPAASTRSRRARLSVESLEDRFLLSPGPVPIGPDVQADKAIVGQPASPRAEVTSASQQADTSAPVAAETRHKLNLEPGRGCHIDQNGNKTYYFHIAGHTISHNREPTELLSVTIEGATYKRKYSAGSFGEFMLPQIPGRYRVEFSYPGDSCYQPESKKGHVIVPYKTTTTLTPLRKSPQRVQVGQWFGYSARVEVESANKAAPGTVVFIISSKTSPTTPFLSEARDIDSETRSATWEYGDQVLPAGEYTITANYQGFKGSLESHEISSAQPLEFTIIRTPSRFGQTGVVRSLPGDP
jgi:hypothetical protein